MAKRDVRPVTTVMNIFMCYGLIWLQQNLVIAIALLFFKVVW